jgi:hypothetical protein
LPGYPWDDEFGALTGAGHPKASPGTASGPVTSQI